LHAEFPNATPGKYEFKFDVTRHFMIAPSRPATVEVAVEVPTAEPEKASEPAHFKVFDFEKLFLFPSVTALAAAILLLLFFHPPAKPVPEAVGH
jgi:hypothetical protein